MKDQTGPFQVTHRAAGGDFRIGGNPLSNFCHVPIVSERTFASRHVTLQHVPRPAFEPRARDQFPCLVEVEARGGQAPSDDEAGCP